MCFMTIEENINEGNEIDVNDDNPSYGDLFVPLKEYMKVLKNC